MPRMHPRLRELLLWTAAGAIIGLVILGAGGRVAMYVVARATTGRGAWTLGGTATVVALGAVSGAAGGALHVVTRWLSGGHDVVRRFLYVVVMLLITWRGISPATTLAASLFFPLVIAFMVALEAAWVRSLLGARPPR